MEFVTYYLNIRKTFYFKIFKRGNNLKMNIKNIRIIVIGKQCTGESKIRKTLEDIGINVASRFTNNGGDPKEASGLNSFYNLDTQTIHNAFESGSLLTLSTNPITGYYQGYTFNDFDNCDIIFVTPNEFLELKTELIREKTLVVWIDSNYESRYRYYVENGYEYNFDAIESIESMYDISFLDNLLEVLKSNKNLLLGEYLYFNFQSTNTINEIIGILYSIIQLGKFDMDSMEKLLYNILNKEI